MSVFQLGGGSEPGTRSDIVRDGAFEFLSRRGLNIATRFLIDALPKASPGRALFGLDTEGAAAMAARTLWPAAAIEWTHLDAYVAQKVGHVLAMNGIDDVPAHETEDIPDGPFDLIALPFPATSDSQLMWDLLEGSHDALAMGGRFVASTDGKPDALRKALKKVFRNVTPGTIGRRGGASFYATRKREAAALSDRRKVVRAVVRPADGADPVPLDLETRPGTFAYRSFDKGTRALAEAWTPAGEDSVLDLGAGCGGLGLYAALRLPAASVTLIDSNARAIGCARRTAQAMDVADRVRVAVRADFEDLPPVDGGYALVLANPPYFGDFRIAHSFATTAREQLRGPEHGGGRALFVAKRGKAGDALRDVVADVFPDVRVSERADYAIVEART